MQDKQKRTGCAGLIGPVIFMLFVFGQPFFPRIANALSQATGLPISPAIIIVGLIIFGVVASTLGSAVRGALRYGQSRETRLPTAMQPPMAQGPVVAQPPPRQQPPPSTGSPRAPQPPSRMSAAGLPIGQEPLPSPPRFEPIFNPRVIGWGVLTLVVFGVLFGIALVILGASMP